MAEFRSGLIAVLGRPNVGKSTLVNTIVGAKVSIVSDKPQTTRRRLLGIATRPGWQIVFVDTPGVHKPHNKLGHLLNETAKRSVQEVDAVLVVVDSSKAPGADDRSIASMLGHAGLLGESAPMPVLMCLNKMDLLKPIDVQANYDAYRRLFQTDKIMMTSFSKKQNIDDLIALLVEHLPEGPPMYADDEITDQTVRSLAAEFVREKALRLTRQEVPHAVATYVESWEEDAEKNLVRISCVVLVETEGQKAIMIGKGGSMLKQIGTEAREDIEEVLDQKVFLELFVRVRPDWRENPSILHELGYTS